ncbi:putative sterigmatocystin biosynthesis P450 monooxygenase, partial [Talaromyces pinophilus]
VLLFFALLWLLSQLVLKTRNSLFPTLQQVPGPLYAPLTNLVLKYHVLSGNRSQYIHSLHKTYGAYVRISPNEISIADLPSVKQIHRVGSDFRVIGIPFSTIVPIRDQKEHGIRRRLFAQNFSNRSLVRFEPQIREKVDSAVSKIKRDALTSRADILKWFTFMATDVIGELNFGVSFDMLKQEQKTQYVRDLETTMIISGIRAELSTFVKLAGMRLSSANASRLTDGLPLKTIRNISTPLQGQIQSAFSPDSSTPPKRDISIPQISAEASNLIVAGSDMTAVSLTYLVWAVNRPQNREIKRKLQAEIGCLPLDASLADISDLKYLRMVVDESLRLYGAAPGSLPRVCPPGGAKLGDYFIPGGTTVSTQAYNLHWDGAIFENPESFVPERWQSPTGDMRHAFMSFGGGSRVCIGMHLAMNELMLGTFVFFKTCPSITLAESTTDASMEIENYFLIAPKSHRCEVKIVK